MPPKPLLLLALCTILSTSMQAQEPRRITLEGKDGVPAPAEDSNDHGAGSIHQVPTPALEIYPTAVKPSHGTIMILPGGGYDFLVIDKEGRDVAKMLNDDGWDAAVLLYRINAGPNTRDLALDDAKKALALLQMNGGGFGLSTRPVGAMGFSAGGHLTARLAHETEAIHMLPSFLVLMYPAYLERDGRLLDEVAPTYTPLFLYVGDKDKTFYPSSEAYAAAYKKMGQRYDYTVAPNVGHGFGLTAHLPEGAKDWPDKLKAFLTPLASKP